MDKKPSFSELSQVGRRIMIAVLAGLLVFYHSSLIIDLVRNQDIGDLETIVLVQSIIRALIVPSLLLVIMRRAGGVAAMWLTISALVISQYVAHFGGLSPEISETRSAFSYLRGFIFPSAISLLYVKRST